MMSFLRAVPVSGSYFSSASTRTANGSFRNPPWEGRARMMATASCKSAAFSRTRARPVSVRVRVPPSVRACPESSSRCRSARAARVRPNRSSPVSVTVACPAAISWSRTAGSVISSCAAGKPGLAVGQELLAQCPPLGSAADLDLRGVPVDRPVGRDVGVVAGVQFRAQVIDQPGVLGGGEFSVQQCHRRVPDAEQRPQFRLPGRPAGRVEGLEEPAGDPGERAVRAGLLVSSGGGP